MKQLPEGFTQFTHEGVLLAYNPMMGEGLRWRTFSMKVDAVWHRKKFSIDGTPHWASITPGNEDKVYTKIVINRRAQKWHRIVAQHFLNDGNPIPSELEIDHREHANGTAWQDRLENLRIVSRRGNQQNQKRGRSQYAGVCWNGSRRKWVVSASNGGKKQFIGNFTDEREAAEAYIAFCQQHNLQHQVALEKLAA